MMFGCGPVGISDAMRLKQRRLAARLAAPAAGTAGQSLDIALVIADGSSKWRADPAYDAHDQPIGQWASAVWNEWLPRIALVKLAGLSVQIS